jgi:ribosomal protein L16/L10AE
MTLPAVLVLLDLYPLRRLHPGAEPRLLRPVLAEKIPYLGLAAAGAAMAILGRQALSFQPASPGERALDVAFTLWFHLGAQAWPVGLSPLYEWPVQLDPRAPRFLVSVAGVVLVTCGAVVFRRRWPVLPAVWAYHVISLGPVLGWAPLGLQLTADRYGHLASLGWALLVGAGVAAGLAAVDRGAVRRRLAWGLAATVTAWLVWLGLASAHQATVWRDGRALWRHAARTDPGCWRCQEALADWLSTDGQLEAARRAYERAVVVNPGALRVRAKIGHLYEEEGRLEEAERTYRGALGRAPGSVALAVDLARVVRRAGRIAEAVDVVRGALEVATDAEVRAQLPRLGAAPDEPLAVLTRVLAAERLGQPAAAAAGLQRLHHLDPELARRTGLTPRGPR